MLPTQYESEAGSPSPSPCVSAKSASALPAALSNLSAQQGLLTSVQGGESHLETHGNLPPALHKMSVHFCAGPLPTESELSRHVNNRLAHLPFSDWFRFQAHALPPSEALQRQRASDEAYIELAEKIWDCREDIRNTLGMVPERVRTIYQHLSKNTSFEDIKIFAQARLKLIDLELDPEVNTDIEAKGKALDEIRTLLKTSATAFSIQGASETQKGGNSYAQWILGTTYKGTPVGIEWLERAAGQKNKWAAYALAEIYFPVPRDKRFDVTAPDKLRDWKTAEGFYLMAADQKLLPALEALAAFYENGNLFDMHISSRKTAHYYHQLSLVGSGKHSNRLGGMYFHQQVIHPLETLLGGGKDTLSRLECLQQARELFQIAFKQGYVSAGFNIALVEAEIKTVKDKGCVIC